MPHLDSIIFYSLPYPDAAILPGSRACNQHNVILKRHTIPRPDTSE